MIKKYALLCSTEVLGNEIHTHKYIYIYIYYFDWIHDHTYKYFNIVRLAIDGAISPFNPLDDKFLVACANNIVKCQPRIGKG